MINPCATETQIKTFMLCSGRRALSVDHSLYSFTKLKMIVLIVPKWSDQMHEHEIKMLTRAWLFFRVLLRVCIMNDHFSAERCELNWAKIFEWGSSWFDHTRCRSLVIPVTRRVKGYTRFVGKYVTGRRKRFRPHKVYIFLIRITSRPSGWTLRSRKLWELGYLAIWRADSWASYAAQVCFSTVPRPL